MNKLHKAVNILKYKLSKASSGMGMYGQMDYEKHKLLVFNAIRWGSCRKEPETVEWIETFGKGDVAYDVGACVGSYSLIMSKYAREVYAFEPAVFNFNILTKNILHNLEEGLIENNIYPMNVALASKTEMGTFNYQSLKDGSSLHSLGNTLNTHGAFTPVLSQKMLAIPIDGLVSIFGAPLPNHIKIDVDGNEKDVLRGASETLKDRRLKSVLVEVYGSTKDEVVRMMEGNGFEPEKAGMHSGSENLIFRRK